jgi:hypothetical protein
MKGQVLHKYESEYYFCETCQYLFVTEPSWLNEAYQEPINIYDTGIIARNLGLSKKTAIILYYLFDHRGQFLDYSGGYGILTRMMRDIGFDYYWCDQYANNVMSRGFEGKIHDARYELVTLFEVLEHLSFPLDEISKIFKLTDNILFTTALLPDPIPQLEEWDYYGADHGQHISFYTKKTLWQISQIFRCQFYQIQKGLFLFSRNNIAIKKMEWLYRLYGGRRLFERVKKHMRSKTESDHETMKNKESLKS